MSPVGQKYEAVPSEADGPSLPRRRTKGLTVTALIVSLLLNLGLLDQLKLGQTPSVVTPYANLEKNATAQWTWKTQNYDNKTLMDELWDERLLDDGVVALDNSFTDAMGLPRGQQFPWDTTKSIYVINAYHNLHCVVILRQNLLDYDQGAPPSHETIHHALHCLDSLRQDIICDADDTPRYAGFHRGKSGDEQARQCRDWNQLRSWAQDNTACYRYDHGSYRSEKIWHYSWCPQGSPYYEASEKKLDELGRD